MLYSRLVCPHLVFFFQAEDGIRDVAVTGVQTCALPISLACQNGPADAGVRAARQSQSEDRRDRKSTRLNSSHGYISYAVFCLKKKKKTLSTHSISSPTLTALPYTIPCAEDTDGAVYVLI